MPKIVSSSCFFNEISSEIQFFLHSTFQKIVLGTPWLLSPEVLDAQATSQQSRIHEFVYYDNINKDEKIVTARAPTGRILWVEDAAAADLWSAGCTLYAMLTGNFPFQPGAMIAGNMDKWHAKMSYAHARTKKPEIEFEEIHAFWRQEKLASDIMPFPTSNPFWARLETRHVSVGLKLFFRELFAENLQRRARSYGQIKQLLGRLRAGPQFQSPPTISPKPGILQRAKRKNPVSTSSESGTFDPTGSKVPVKFASKTNKRKNHDSACSDSGQAHKKTVTVVTSILKKHEGPYPKS